MFRTERQALRGRALLARAGRCLACALMAALALPLAADQTTGAGLVWRVAGANNTMYLVGSVHMLRESDFPLASPLEEAYREAEILVMELDMDDLNPFAVQALLFTHGRLSGEQTLAGLLGTEDWQRASAAADELGLDLGMLNKVKPWWAAITIVQLRLARLGFDPEHGLESYFARRAAEDEKPIEGLETAVEQIELFDNMAMENQIQMLIKSLEDAAHLEQEMERLLAAWRGGHADELAALQTESFGDFPDLYASLIRERNASWVAELAELLDDKQDYMVIVGALHLAGKDSVVAGLERMGYRVYRP